MILSTATAVTLPLAANWVQAAWIDALGPLLVVGFWILRAVLGAVGEAREAERANREGPREEPFDLDDEIALDDDPDGREKPEPKQGELRSEVEDFLRRIGELPAEEAKAEQADAGRQIDLEDEADADDPPVRRKPIDPFEEPPRRQRQRQQPTRPAAEARQTPPPAVELLIDPEPPKRTESVRDRRELRHLPESQLAEQAAHLGENVAAADDRLEARLHDKFDHRLGKLRRDETSETKDAKPDTPAVADLAGARRIKELLSRPGGVREAVVLSEILRRPGDQL
ncbi:MAG: hypothetical protein AAF266_06320 [Planctomycetota bacterium]